MAKNNWFAVDKDGLRKLIDDRGKAFVLFELIQNAWDTDATRVDIVLEKLAGRPFARLVVTDDDPSGFHDLAHSYTLYAESLKKNDPTKRGRFNLGEKLVLAVCKSASVTSTSGSVHFEEDGTLRRGRSKTEVGSTFSAEIRMTNPEYDEVCHAVQTLIPKVGVRTTFNGEALKSWKHKLVATFEAILPTLVANDEGVLTRTRRKTQVSVYETEGGGAWVYELGIPVVETGDKYHIDVHQKVPLNMDRDNVPPSFLKRVRAEVLNRTASQLSKEEASEAWVTHALESEDVEAAAVEKTLDKRFGKKRAIFDPQDQEANMNLTAQGFTVISGGSLPKGAWSNIKRYGAAKPSGQLAPTPKPFSMDPNAPVMREISRADWTREMVEVEDVLRFFASELEVHDDLLVRYGLPSQRHWSAAWGGGFTWNVTRLGRKWFQNWYAHPHALLDIMIHEFAHHKASNHLDEGFHKACTTYGARVGMILFLRPDDVPHFRRVRFPNAKVLHE